MAPRSMKPSVPEATQAFENFGATPEAIALSLLIKMAELDGINLSAEEIPGKSRVTGKWVLVKYLSIVKEIKT